MKSPLIKSIGEVVTDYGARVMKVIKKGLLGRSLFDFYGDVKADTFKTRENASVPITPADGKGGVMYTKSSDGKLYYKSNEVAEVELSTNQATTFILEDGDGTEVTLSQGKELKIVEGTGIDVDWTDTDNGTDADPFDITISCDLEGTELKSTGEGGGTKFLREDGDGTSSWQTTPDTNTQLTQEQVEDYAGALAATGGTKTGISVTYQDGTGDMDFEVDHDAATNFVAAEHYRWDNDISGTATVNAANIPTLNQNTSGSSGSCTGNAATATNLTASTSTSVGLGTVELGHASDTTIARSAAGTVTIEGKEIVTSNKVRQVFNLGFIDDIGTTEHFLSWRDQYENSSSTSSDYIDTNMIVPANGRVVCVIMRVGVAATATVTRTVKVYSQNPGFMQSQVSQETEAVSVTSSDDWEAFQFYFSDAEHFQAGDLLLVSIQDGADIGGSGTYHVSAVVEFDYTQMGRTDSGEIA
jgi:hypothetical protein